MAICASPSMVTTALWTQSWSPPNVVPLTEGVSQSLLTAFPSALPWTTAGARPHTTHSWPGCGNCNFHAPRALDAHRWGLWHSPTSPTLSTEATYQPRFFLTATCPSLDSMPVKKQKCYEMKFIALKGIAHKLSSPLTFCMSNFCSFVFSHIQCPETVT